MSLDAIGIVSASPNESVRFYALLGVSFANANGHEHWEAKTPSGIRLMLDSVALIRTIDPGYEPTTRSGVVLCFKQASPAAVDALYEKIVGAGFSGKKAPWDAFWGQRYACVLDPDGNQIDLFADR